MYQDREALDLIGFWIHTKIEIEASKLKKGIIQRRNDEGEKKETKRRHDYSCCLLLQLSEEEIGRDGYWSWLKVCRNINLIGIKI